MGMKTVTVQDGGVEQRRVDQAACGRLLIVHSHAAMGAGLKLALSERSWEVETTTGPTAADITDAAHCFGADCVLTDVHLHHGDGCGISLIAPLVSDGVQVVMLTAERRRLVLAECLDAGAAGWIGLDSGLDEVDLALQNVVAGRPIIGRTRRAELLDLLRAERSAARTACAIFEKLTPREALVLVALTDGLTADEIAGEHFVSVATVRSQIRAVLQKLGVRSQLAAVAIADAHRDLLPQGMTSGTDRRQSDRKGRGTDHLLPARTA
jgi:DNA-binding NarL/FixJ family response regulator